MAGRLRIRVPPDRSGDRLDVVVAKLGRGLSRRAARRLIGQGSVFVDGKRVQVNGRPVKAGAVVTVEQPGPLPRAQGGPPPEVLHAEGDLLVANKASGTATEPTRQAAAGSLAQALRSHLSIPGRDFLAAAHRLDVETSGVVVFARSPDAARRVSSAFQADAVERRYLALVTGEAPFLTEVIDLPLSPMDKSGRRRVDRAGKPSETVATTLAVGHGASLLLITPRTGRTHQIRVHLAAIGLPLVGDRRYGEGPRGPAFGLHALALRARTGELRLGAFAPPPPALVEVAARAGVPPEVLTRVAARYERWAQP